MSKTIHTDRKKPIILFILMIITMGSTLYLLYALSLLKGIETKTRFVFAVTLIVLMIGFIYGHLRSFRKKKSKYLLYIPLVAVYSVILVIFGNYIIKTFKIVDNMTTNKDYYYSSFVVLKSNKSDDLKQFSDGAIGMLGDSTSIDGYQIPKEIIQNKKLKNEVKDYETYIALIQALYDKEIEGAFLPSSYVSLFSQTEGYEFENLGEDTKIIHKEEKQVKKQLENKNASLKDPFTVLLTGVDSERENIANSVFNGDSLMLITFNPTTLSATMLSIPRDTYVPIACVTGKPRSKITHAASYGQQCMMDTIQNYTGIKIDYYIKMNFKGVVKLVDTLGGIDLDVPFAFCEQNSNREWGNNTVYVEKGFQTLTGEQSLAFARHREDVWSRKFCPKKYIGQGVVNDFVRGQHQQLIVRSLLNKMKTVRSLDTVYKLLDTVSNSMETNMSTSQILSLYNIGKDIISKSSGEEVENLLGIQKLYLSGSDAYLYDPIGRATLYEYLVYEDSLEEVVEAMKINLGLEEPTISKSFSFTIDETYEEEVPGKSGSYSKLPTTGSIPDFTGDTETQARSYAVKHKISIKIVYSTTGKGTNGTVISQNVKAGTDIKKAGTVTLTILKKETQKEPNNPSDSNEDKNDKNETDKDTNKDDDKTNTDDKKDDITTTIPGIE